MLVTDGSEGQSRSSLAATRALGIAGYSVTVTATGDGPSLAGMSRYCDRLVRVPSFDGEGYAGAVRSELDSKPYLFALPASDGAMIALGDPAARLVDKAQLAALARDAGLQVVPTTAFDDGRDLLAADDTTFPIVIKPREKIGLDGGIDEATRVDGGKALAALAPSITRPIVVQPFVDAPLRAIAGVFWQGGFVAIVHQRTSRTWPLECGVSSAATTVEPDVHKEESLRTLLNGYDGIFQAQFLGDYLIDLNPRVYGSMPLAVASGVNLPGILGDCILGHAPDLVRAHPGVRYRWVEGDVRNLLAQAKRGMLRRTDVLDAFRPHARTAHSVGSVVDPWPLVGRLRFAAGKWRR